MRICIKAVLSALVLATLLAGGCAGGWPRLLPGGDNKPTRETGNSRRGENGEAGLSPQRRQALELERQGRYVDALVLYQRMREDGVEPEEGALGAARCLLRMNKPPAALAALSPLPEHAANVRQRQILALAGQALLQMKSHKRAREALDAALKGYDGGTRPPQWAGAAYANLGTARLEDGDVPGATAAFRNAGEVYALLGAQKEADECMRVAVGLDRIAESGE